MFSYAEHQAEYQTHTKEFNLMYVLEKEKENQRLHDALTKVVQTTSQMHILMTI
jgi:hypothetical protein